MFFITLLLTIQAQLTELTTNNIPIPVVTLNQYIDMDLVSGNNLISQKFEDSISKKIIEKIKEYEILADDNTKPVLKSNIIDIWIKDKKGIMRYISLLIKTNNNIINLKGIDINTVVDLPIVYEKKVHEWKEKEKALGITYNVIHHSDTFYEVRGLIANEIDLVNIVLESAILKSDVYIEWINNHCDEKNIN
jgi:hypothetical protein